MSRSPSLPDRPRLDLDPEMSDAERLAAIKQHYERIVQVHDELDDRLEDANERRQELREEVDQLQRRNEMLKTSSLYIATVEELTDDGVVIKQHGNNQEVLTDVTPRLEGRLDAGDRVAVNDSFAVQSVLDDETDSRAQAMEITDSPGVSYDDIGGLEEQIRDVREAVEIPLENPSMFDDVGIDPPAGVLLHGPPGTGKSLLAREYIHLHSQRTGDFVAVDLSEGRNRLGGSALAQVHGQLAAVGLEPEQVEEPPAEPGGVARYDIVEAAVGEQPEVVHHVPHDVHGQHLGTEGQYRPVSANERAHWRWVLLLRGA